MATLVPTAQEIMDPFRDGVFLVVTKAVITGTSSDTIALPEGLQSVNHVTIVTDDYSNTAPSASSISQSAHPGGATLTIASGGTAGATVYIFSLHAGSQAGL